MRAKRKIVIVPDKFKGSLTAAQVADCIEVALRERMIGLDKTEIVKIPLADGGDGSLDVLAAILGEQGEIVEVDTFDPLMRPMKAPILFFEKEGVRQAFIEMTKCCGLVLLKPEERNPEKTTTFGLGVMMRKAIELGAEKVILGIGGSATNDGGLGLLKGFAADRRNLFGEQNDPYLFPDIPVLAVCDVENPLLGPNGATMVYAPQKGADRAMLERLEERMISYAEWAEAELIRLGTAQSQTIPEGLAERAARFRTIPGGGAAGGVGAALYGFFGAELISGWKLFSKIVSLEEQITGADAVITAEGRFDFQSLSGKLVGGVASLCKIHKKRLYVVCGQSQLPSAVWKKQGIYDVFALSEVESDVNRSIANAEALLSGRQPSVETQVGCDEAGRGCLAGPVFAAAVVLPKGFYHPLLGDSKQLSEHQRNTLREIIEREAIAWSVQSVSAAEIDRINILNASIKAMQLAVADIQVSEIASLPLAMTVGAADRGNLPNEIASLPLAMIFVDGNKFKPYGNTPHHCIVKGDSKMACIAAASILAKTHRDEYMRKISKEYPQYGWDKNMAYPTADHRAAIKLYGPSPYHRLSYNLSATSFSASKTGPSFKADGSPASPPSRIL